MFFSEGKNITVKWVSSSFGVELNASTTLAVLVGKILDQWEKKLLRVDFTLHYGDAHLEINNDGALESFFKTQHSTILVKSQAEGFSKLNKTDVFNWAGSSHFEDFPTID